MTGGEVRVPRSLTALIAVAAFIYFGVWLYIGYPYDVVPSDDAYKYLGGVERFFALGGLDRLAVVYRFNVPVTLVVLVILKAAAGLVGFDMESILLLSASAGGALTVVAVALIAYYLTASRLAAYTASAVLAFSSWPATYMFFFESAALGAPVALLSLVCLMRAYLSDGPSRRWLAVSGILGVVACFTYTAALLFVCVQTALFHFLFAYGREARAARSMRVYYWYALAAMVPFSRTLLTMASHIRGNVLDNHFGRIWECGIRLPDARVFMFGRIMHIYAPYLWVVFMSLTALAAALFVMRPWRKGHNERAEAEGRTFWLGTGLLAAVWVAIMSVEILPLTKVARNYYVLYPLVVALTVSFGFDFYKRLSSRLPFARAAAMVLGLVLLVVSLASNIEVMRETVYYKQSTPRLLRGLSGLVDISTVAEDPHGKYIKVWLKDFVGVEEAVRVAAEAALQAPRWAAGAGRSSALMVGPTGPRSGRSFLRFGCLKDFDFDYRKYRYVVLPYFAYYPPFMMEEEVAQALYVSSMAPDYRDEDGNIKLVFVE